LEHIKTTRAVSAAHNFNTMKDAKKTPTGLHIKQKGKRIEVYTPKEIEQFRERKDSNDDLIIAFTLSGLLLMIGFLIGISI
jgi:hypothetical protein